MTTTIEFKNNNNQDINKSNYPRILHLIFSPHLLLGNLHSLPSYLIDKDIVCFMRTCSSLYQTEYPTISL